MSSVTMDQSKISCSPALTDEDFTEGTISFNNNDKNICKYPEHSYTCSMLGEIQPVLSGSSNSDKSVTYTGPFPDDEISNLQSSPKTTCPDDIICASDTVHKFKEPCQNKFKIKPVTFSNSLRKRRTNSDDSDVKTSIDSMETVTQNINLKNSLNDTDTCTSAIKIKSSGFWRKRSCMVNSYVFEAALDETSFDNTINKSNGKFTFRRKRKLQADDNSFSKAFSSQTMSDSSENNESMEYTNKVRGKLLDNTLTQNSLIECNVKTRGFKMGKQFKYNEKRFSEAFNNTEIADHSISQEINKKMVELNESSQTEESLQNCDNFCRAIRNNKQMVTSSIFQNVFNESDSLNPLVPKSIAVTNNLSNKDGDFLPTVCSEHTTQINEHSEYSDSNILHKKQAPEEMTNSLQTASVQNGLNNLEGNKSLDRMIRRDLDSQNQQSLEGECNNNICGETKLKEKMYSNVEANDREKESEECNEAYHTTSNVSMATVENDPLKKTESDSLLTNSHKSNKTCTNNSNAEISQNTRILSIHSKKNKQNEVNSIENVDISMNLQETSCFALQNIVREENDYVNKTFHKTCLEDDMNTLKIKKNDQADLNDSEQFKSLDAGKNTLNHNTTSSESELKHLSFHLGIQEEHSALDNKISVCINPDEGTTSATSDNHVIHKLTCIQTKRKSNLGESNKVASDTCPHIERRKQNIEYNSVFTDQNAGNVKDAQPYNENICMLSHTGHVCNTENREGLTASDNSLINFESLVYNESEDKIREGINDGESVLFEFHASKDLKFCSSTRSSVYSTVQNLSKQSTELSEALPDFKTRTQNTGESNTVLNSLNNSWISTEDEDTSENRPEDTYEPIETYSINNSLDTTLTENTDSACDLPNHTQDPDSLDTSRNIFCVKSTEKCINIKLKTSKSNVMEQNFSNVVNRDAINRLQEGQNKEEKLSPAVQRCATKSFLQKTPTLQTQVGKHQSQTFMKRTENNNASAHTSNDSHQKQKQSENRENTNKANKSRKFSTQSKQINNKSSINAESSKNNESSEPDVLDDMTSEILSENGNKTQTFTSKQNCLINSASVNTSLSDCSNNIKLHSKINKTSNQSPLLKKIIKDYSQNNKKQVDSTAENALCKNSCRSRKHSNESIDHSDKNIFKKRSTVGKAATVLKKSNKNSDFTQQMDSTNNTENNKTLENDESNDDNGYDVGYNTFSFTNVDHTPCNEANKRNYKRKLNALRKCLFNSSILQNEADARKFCIPLSELHKRKKKKLLNEENKCVQHNSFTVNKFGDYSGEVRNKNYTQLSKYGNWATKTTKDFLISKLRARYGVKASWRCQKLVDFMAIKIKEAIGSNTNYNVPVDEIKLELARLNIIETNLDFYMFVLKYLRQYEPDFVFKSVPCIQTFGRRNLVPRPPNSYLKEKIL